MQRPVTKQLRMGVIGTGPIAQVMHWHFLREPSESGDEIAALGDTAEKRRSVCR